MAVFDVEQQRMCVRVVYDGVASAGKTTNVQQLAELFATQKTCELFSPAEMDGRTLYFDWLQIAAGMVCGFPLVCQVITVPGQIALTARRRHLLSTADVVVHVCDSEAQSVSRAQDGLALFDEIVRERGEGLPLVIQGNKQDQEGALSGPALVAALGRTGVPVVEAIASDGIGVVDTFVAAVRGAVKAIQARVEAGDVRVAVRSAETSAAVLRQLTEVSIDPDWEIEMLLEEASNAFMVGEPIANRDSMQAVPTIGELSVTWRPSTLGPPLVLPSEHVPTGFIWPAHTGRSALRALAADPEMKRAVALDGQGQATVVAGDFVLGTNRERRFEGEDHTRQALVRAARERTQLGSLLAPETVLVAQPAGDGASWLWTVLPVLPTVASLVEAQVQADASPAALLPTLTTFGTALAEALKVEATHGMALDLSPRTFGVRQGVARYLGELGGAGQVRDAAAAVFSAFTALAAVCEDIEPALSAFETGLAARLSNDDLDRLVEHSSITEDGSATAPAGRSMPEAYARIVGAFKRGRRAA